MSIKVGSKVNTPKGTGVVINTYDFSGIPIVITKLEDETVSKFLQEDVKEIPEVEEPVEETKDTITISREEFRTMYAHEVGELLAEAFIKGERYELFKIAPLLGAKIEVALFGEPAKNV